MEDNKFLAKYEEEIYKCSRCGLCQSVCPVYKASLNECAVSKAKFNMLNGVLKGELAYSAKLKSYFDFCTGCNACKDFCPSQIDAKEIFQAVKAHYYDTKKLPFFEKFLNSIFLFKSALVFAKIFFFFYRGLKLYCITDLIKPLLLKFGILGKRFLLLNSLAKKNYVYKKSKNVSKNIKKAKKAIYFKGCINSSVNSETLDSVKKILENSEIELVEKDFECCGVSYLQDGMLEQFKNIIEKNSSKVDLDYDYLLTDCASCHDVLGLYKNYSDTEAAKNISEKVTSVVELIQDMKFVSNKNFKVALHIPCHETGNLENIINNISNIEYVKVDEYEKCCGFAGKFALRHSEISREISRKKAQNYINADVDVVLTTCPSCILGLRQGFFDTSSTKQPVVMNLFVFLAKYCC